MIRVASCLRFVATTSAIVAPSSPASAQDATTRVNVSTAGAEAKTESWLGAISSTGRHVVFSSGANNLVSGDTNHAWDVFARDRDPDVNGIFDEGNDVTTRMSLDSGGAEGDDWSTRCAISADGRHVVFESLADNLVANDTNSSWDVFAHDRDPDGNGIFDEGNDVTVRMNLSSSQAQADSESGLAKVSADGRYVAFESLADNLVAGDTNGFSDVFVRDRDPDGNGIFDEGNGVTIRMSIRSSGLQGNDDSHDSAISANGRHVAFDSRASNLVPGDDNDSIDVFVHDRDPDGNGIFDEGNGATWRVSVDSSGVDDKGDSYAPALSGDGRYVIFHSVAAHLVPGDTNLAADVFVRDRDPDGNGIFDEGNSVTRRLSVDSSGVEGNGNSYAGAISDSGRHVAFYGSASNLVTLDTNGASDVFLQDRDPDGNGIYDEGNNVTTRSSVTPCGFEGDSSSTICEISADGRSVAFESTADNLVASDANGRTDVFVNDRALLPPDASWRNYGAGFAGTLGVPTITASANPVFGTSFSIAIGNSLGAATPGIVLAGVNPASIPTGKGGTILVTAKLLVPLTIAPAGDSLSVSIPNDPALCGVSAFVQAIEADAGAQFGLSFTAGLELDLGH